jgi:hypothetical protein
LNKSSDFDIFSRLQDWFLSNCDGDWENSSGVKVESLDNPGWMVSLDIFGTPLEGRLLDRVVVDDSEEGWLHCWSDGNSIYAAAAPCRLRDALEIVLDRLLEWGTVVN